MINIFDQPLNYILEITNKVKIPSEKRKEFPGKTMAFVFLTKFCDVECAHCFFRSKKKKKVDNLKEYELSEEGLEDLIAFLNASNNGYLSILGGGEPFNRFDYIKKILEKVKTDRVILVTSGNWAEKKEKAEKIIAEIQEIMEKRNDKMEVILRISVDKWHRVKIKSETICNIIEIMDKGNQNSRLKLQLHGIAGDSCIEETLKCYGNFTKENSRELASDNEEILKIGYQRYDAVLESGMRIEVGIAQKFASNLKVNLKNQNPNLTELIKVFDDDIEWNCFGNPSLVKNKNETFGLDFLISYNGNVSTWCNEQTYDLNNLYLHDYQKVINRSMDNIISYSFIDKGYQYRESVFSEVNPLAVLKSKAVNIRDYSCALLMEERNSVLYYAIRVIQDYLEEGILEAYDLSDLSEDLKNVVDLEKSELIKMYQSSTYTIFEEYIANEKVTLSDWKDLFNLVELGHYNVTEQDIQKALLYFNEKYNQNIKNISELKENSDEQYERLLNRVSYMRSGA